MIEGKISFIGKSKEYNYIKRILAHIHLNIDIVYILDDFHSEDVSKSAVVVDNIEEALEKDNINTVIIGFVDNPKDIILKAIEKGINILLHSFTYISSDDYFEIYSKYNEEKYYENGHIIGVISPYISSSKIIMIKNILKLGGIGDINSIYVNATFGEIENLDTMFYLNTLAPAFFIANTDNIVNVKLNGLYCEKYYFEKEDKYLINIKLFIEQGIDIFGIINSGFETNQHIRIECSNGIIKTNGDPVLLIEYNNGIKEKYLYQENEDILIERVYNNFFNYINHKEEFIYSPIEDVYQYFQFKKAFLEQDISQKVVKDNTESFFDILDNVIEKKSTLSELGYNFAESKDIIKI